MPWLTDITTAEELRRRLTRDDAMLFIQRRRGATVDYQTVAAIKEIGDPFQIVLPDGRHAVALRREDGRWIMTDIKLGRQRPSKAGWRTRLMLARANESYRRQNR